jgi:hypothetical protein
MALENVWCRYQEGGGSRIHCLSFISARVMILKKMENIPY